MNRTDPTSPSAPLPPQTTIETPSASTLVEEIKRASTELLWALHRQRTSWARMAKVKAELEAKGLAYFPEAEREWKLATGDVTWWRGEVSSRSNALSALLQLASMYDIKVTPPRPRVSWPS